MQDVTPVEIVGARTGRKKYIVRAAEAHGMR